MTRRAFTPEQDRQLAREYEAGATFGELSDKYGGTEQSVRSAVRRAGVKGRVGGKLSGWSDGCESEAARLYEQGMSVKHLARHFSTRDTVISEALRVTGVRLRPGGRAHPRFRSLTSCQEVARVYERANSLQEVAVQFNCSTPTIVNALRRAGVEVAPGGRPRFWTEERRAQAVRLYKAGLSQQAIADELGAKQVAVSNVLRSEGVVSPAPRASGSSHGSWKGGRVVTSKGYIHTRPALDDMQFCRPNISGYVAEHRLVMGRAIGRPLADWESVHHIDGDRTNNALENLQLRQGRHGAGVVMTCNSCGSHDVTAQEIAEPDVS